MGLTVFISYATKDKDRFKIAWIAEQLRDKQGIDEVLYWEAAAHGSIIDYMNKNVPRCDVFLLFCSQNTLSSKPIQTEWETAQYFGKKIIPIFQTLDHVPPLLQRLRGILFRGTEQGGTLADLYREIISQIQEEKRGTKSDKAILKELEQLIGKSIPAVATIEYDTFGMKLEEDTLVGLGLYNCKLTALPESFGDLKSLQILSIDNNQLMTLPKPILQLKSLQELDLGHNQLTTLPESFGHLESLQILDLISNKLTTLPESFGELKSLQTLWINDNKLTTLPESFGELKSLQELQIDNNHLMNLPESFGHLESLNVLFLNSNKLRTLPEYLWSYAPKASEVLLCIAASSESGPLLERAILARAVRTMSKKEYRQALHLLLHPILFQLKESYHGKDSYPVVLVERRSIEARRDARAEYSLTPLARKVVQVLRKRSDDSNAPIAEICPPQESFSVPPLEVADATFKIPWDPLTLDLECVIPGLLYQYNHYMTVKPFLDKFGIDDLLKQQIRSMPRLFLFFIQEGDQKTVLIVDPIGEEDPVAADFIKDFFRPNYLLILQKFIGEVEEVYFKKVNLRQYTIQICISHLHPDHWRGLPLLLQALRPLVKDNQQHYPQGVVEVFVPNQTRDKLLNFKEKVVEEENAYLARKMGWDRELIAGIRAICDLHYGKWAELAPFPSNMKLSQIVHQKIIGPTSPTPLLLTSTSRTHGGTILLIAFEWKEVRYVFLDDLFPPAFALATSYPEYASYSHVKETYRKFLTKIDLCFWSHHYRPVGWSAYDLLSDYREDIQDEFEEFVNIVTEYYNHYESKRSKNKNWSEARVHKEVFKQWLADRNGLHILITHYLHMNLDEQGNIVEKAMNITLDDLGKISELLQLPSARITIKERSFQEEVARRKEMGVEGDYRNLLKDIDYDMKFRVTLTAKGREPFTITPSRFQSAILIMTVFINILEYCENEYRGFPKTESD